MNNDDYYLMLNCHVSTTGRIQTKLHEFIIIIIINNDENKIGVYPVKLDPAHFSSSVVAAAVVQSLWMNCSQQ